MTRTLTWLALGLCTSFIRLDTAAAADTCRFSTFGSTWYLRADCETDSTLSIPHGFTLDGRGHRITAVDPPDGHFLGAVVRNGGTIAHVRNLTIDTRALAAVCDDAGGSDDRLRGILFEGASGSIVKNRVLELRQTELMCQEGNAIEVRNPPYDGTHPNTQRVAIAGNYARNYQRTGILVNGDVAVQVTGNRLIGVGPIDTLAQNGIQLGYGAYGNVRFNRVERNLYTGESFGSSGVLLLTAGEPIEVSANVIEDCDLGIIVDSTRGARIAANRVEHTDGGVGVHGVNGEARDNTIRGNWIVDSRRGIDVFGESATDNRIELNWVSVSEVAGIQVVGGEGNRLAGNHLRHNGHFGVWLGADANLIERNFVFDTAGIGLHIEGEANHIESNLALASDGLDIENSGDNSYAANRCSSSSGEPVDCP